MSNASSQLLVSVIIDNYNYGRYLAEAIDSALAQSYPSVEVIVVDDGSTDNSRDIIAEYGNRVIPILKPNGGQASAFNAGFAISRGEVVIFLDSDDIMLANALNRIIPLFAAGDVAKVHWPLTVVDCNGCISGGLRPPHSLAEGDLRDLVLQRGPSNISSSPTSGNAWSHDFLQRVLPVPEDVDYYRSCADEFLYTLAPVFGRVCSIAQPLGCYRIHGQNVYSSRSFRQKLDLELNGYEQQCRALSTALARNGFAVDVERWKQHSWFGRLNQAIETILSIIPVGSSFVLIDGNTWDADEAFSDRQMRRFFEHEGCDWGPPSDSRQAIARVTQLIAEHVGYLVVGWPSFWWFDEYVPFFKHLNGVANCVSRNDVVAIFDLSG